MAKYYSVQRPVSIGTYPMGSKVKEIENFQERKFISKIKRWAWGYLIYSEPIPENLAVEYELVRADE